MAELPIRPGRAGLALLLPLLCLQRLLPASFSCDLSVLRGRTLYNYSLASATPASPHGALSEDGFYRVVVNGTLLWFQLCDQMIFNHDLPRCFGCEDCGGPSHCGMKCSALISKNIGGYHVCTTIGQASSLDIRLIDSKNPRQGVTLKMSTNSPRSNCSLSVSVVCDMNGAQGPGSMEALGSCDYATVMRHPSGCPKVISVGGNGLGWFGTLFIILFCLLGVYMSAGIAFRFFFLGIRGVDVIPNLEFWASIPHRLRILLSSLLRRVRGRHRGAGSYAPMDY